MFEELQVWLYDDLVGRIQGDYSPKGVAAGVMMTAA